MGLLKALVANDTTTGIALADAYHKVTEYAGCDDFVAFKLATYVDQAARTANKDPVLVRNFELRGFDHTDVKAFKRKLYEHLKTLPAFTDATDA